MIYRILMCLLLSISGLVYAQDCPPGPFDCIPWGPSPSPTGPGPVPPPPFFIIAPKQPDDLSDIYDYANKQPNLMLINEDAKAKIEIIRRAQESNILLDDDSLYYFSHISGKNVIFKGSEILK